jgi:Uma2 family endonuclease
MHPDVIPAERLFTVQEWLVFEKKAGLRHEYYYGKLIPMAGEAKRANTIAGNIKKMLDDPLYDKGIQLYDHDVKVQVIPNSIYRYPDLVAAPVADDEDDYIVKHPVFIAEIASEDSNKRDRILKRKQYFQVASLQHYLIADQDEMLLELHSRKEDGAWLPPQYFTEPEEEVVLSFFDLKFTVSAVYQRTKLP